MDWDQVPGRAVGMPHGKLPRDARSGASTMDGRDVHEPRPDGTPGASTTALGGDQEAVGGREAARSPGVQAPGAGQKAVGGLR